MARIGPHLKPEIHALQMTKLGLAVLRQVPGLKRRVALGFFVNMLVYYVLVGLSIFLYYHFIHAKLFNWLWKNAPGWLIGLGALVLVLVLIGVILLALLLSLRVSIRLMGQWYEALVEKIVDFKRERPEQPFRLQDLLQSLKHTLLDLTKEIGIIMGLACLALIPLLGEILVFLISSYLIGNAVTTPYRNVLRAMGETLELGPNPVFKTTALGLGQTGIAIIPIFGAILLPILVLLQVLGFAWAMEQRRGLPQGS